MQIPVLETPRLRLRPHRVEDLSACAVMWADPMVVRFISGEPFTRQQVWMRILAYTGHWPTMGFGHWVVEEKTANKSAENKFVGEVGFANFERQIEPPITDPELGWVLAPEFHGKGYATEALQAAIQWGDQNLNSNRTICIIDPANLASLRVAEKLGYKELLRTTFKGQPTIMFERKI